MMSERCIIVVVDRHDHMMVAGYYDVAIAQSALVLLTITITITITTLVLSTSITTSTI